MNEPTYPRGKYRLTMKAYASRKPGGDLEMLEPGTEIEYEGKPGPHMEALDDDAKVAKALAGEQRLDPHNVEPLNGGDDDERLAVKIADAVSKAMVVAIPQIITAVMDGMAKAQKPAPAAPVAPPVAPPLPPPPHPPKKGG